jgi:co-chaperonin GroES (HSP10)
MIKPLFARVLLEREKPEKIGSIHVPQEFAARQASTKCRVVAKGPNADESIRIGSWVLIGKFAGDWIDEDGKPVPEGQFYICQDEDIIAELEDERRDDHRATEHTWTADGGRIVPH